MKNNSKNFRFTIEAIENIQKIKELTGIDRDTRVLEIAISKFLKALKEGNHNIGNIELK